MRPQSDNQWIIAVLRVFSHASKLAPSPPHQSYFLQFSGKSLPSLLDLFILFCFSRKSLVFCSAVLKPCLNLVEEHHATMVTGHQHHHLLWAQTKSTCFLDKHSWVAIKFLSFRGRYLCSKDCVILNEKHPHLLLENLLKLINLVHGKNTPLHPFHFSWTRWCWRAELAPWTRSPWAIQQQGTEMGVLIVLLCCTK